MLTVAGFLGGLVIGGSAVGGVWALRAAIDAARAQNSSEDAASADGADDAALTDLALEERLAHELPRLQEFVEGERELEFLDDVNVEILPSAEYEEARLEVNSTTWDGGRKHAATYQALGLIEDADAYMAAESSTLEGHAALYQPSTGRLVIHEGEWVPVLEVRLIHELTHALQDQHFDLIELRTASESSIDHLFTFAAIVEGDAGRVTTAFMLDQDEAWQDEFYNTLRQMDLAQPGEGMADLVVALPDFLGEGAVTDLFASGGGARIDRAIRALPAPSNQLFDPDRWLSEYLGNRPTVDIQPAAPPPGAEILDENTLGAAMLSTLPVDYDDEYYPEVPIEGWRGDRYVTWRDGDQTCTALTVAFDNDDSVQAALDLLDPWADRTGGTVEPVEVISVLRGLGLTSCSNPAP